MEAEVAPEAEGTQALKSPAVEGAKEDASSLQPDVEHDELTKARKQSANYRERMRDAEKAVKALEADIEELKSGKKVSEQERALREKDAQIEAANQRASVILQVAPLAQAEHVPPHWVMEDIDEEGIDGTDPQALRDVVKESAARFREEMAPFLPDMAAKAGYVKVGEAPASSQEAPPSQEQGEQGQPPVEQVPRATLDVTGAPPANASTHEQMMSRLSEAFGEAQKSRFGSAKEQQQATEKFQRVRQEVRAMPGGLKADAKFAGSLH